MSETTLQKVEAEVQKLTAELQSVGQAQVSNTCLAFPFALRHLSVCGGIFLLHECSISNDLLRSRVMEYLYRSPHYVGWRAFAVGFIFYLHYEVFPSPSSSPGTTNYFSKLFDPPNYEEQLFHVHRPAKLVCAANS